ncbi:hypothetical protein CEXT_329811 [Caerostris extrusa]|uniref:Uncharacterized protein n=1 Tax=Caerostris extrusa TaxID=172846 RepID=A0AAV4MSC0_CAEEX|nr:hypothetical protein CEXT_329811 [Caerostris extrusa]
MEPSNQIVLLQKEQFHVRRECIRQRTITNWYSPAGCKKLSPGKEECQGVMNCSDSRHCAAHAAHENTFHSRQSSCGSIMVTLEFKNEFRQLVSDRENFPPTFYQNEELFDSRNDKDTLTFDE